MIGNIAIVSILVADVTTRWCKNDIDEYMKALDKSELFLLNNGGYDAGLSVSLKMFYKCDLKCKVDREEYGRTVDDVLHELGYNTICELRDDVIKNNHKVNSVVVLFGFNNEERSFAMSIKGRKNANSTRRAYTDSGEYAFIYFKSHRDISYTLCHEILHLYGAIDYYYPDTIKKQAERFFPHSIMLCYYEKPYIDDLTRYLIGWNANLDSTSLLFLNNTLCTRRRAT